MSNTNQMLSNVNTDAILAETLTNFNTTYIIDVVRRSIDIRFRPYSTAMPGLNSIEMNFQEMLANFTDRDQQARILDVRRQTYDEIISIVCQYYNLKYTPNDDIDNYTVAYFLYHVLVSNFTETIINFFVRYIIDHQDDIYKTITIPENKEALDNYSRKLYGSAAKLGHIHSQINKVMNNISASNITFEQILHYGSGDPSCINILTNTISDLGDIWSLRFAHYLIGVGTRADLITTVKLQLQQFATADINMMLAKEN